MHDIPTYLREGAIRGARRRENTELRAHYLVALKIGLVATPIWIIISIVILSL